MKKTFIVLFAMLIMAVISVGCSGASAIKDNTNKISIVTTIFPEYDWVREIVGDTDSAEITMLLDSGVDLHSYQPTAEDIIKISTCDMFIYVGGESDKWVEDALKEATNKDMVVISLLEVLGDSVKEEEIVEGMEGEEKEDDADGNDDEIEYDEHVWLSIKNAKTLCGYIADKLCTIDADNAEKYRSNADAYISELDALDSRYQSAVDATENNTLLFGDRFPFRYLFDDYGLSYYAAFVGCSAETEASFETVTFLAGKVDELGLTAVLTIENNDKKIANTIVSNTNEKNQKILAMDSLQAVTASDVKSGTTYLSVMENNLEVLKEALQGKASAVQTEDTEATEAQPKATEEQPEATEEQPEVTELQTEATEASAANDNEKADYTEIDVDLTQLSSIMVYSEVYNMMVTPEDYVGKVVKMNGPFSIYEDPVTGNVYFAVIISDATACCSQGLEFVLAGDYSYPDDYPEIGTELTVTGTFETYEEDGYMYCHLARAIMQ